MARNPEQRILQTVSSTIPQAPQFKEVTRFSGEFLQKVSDNVDDFFITNPPDSPREEVVKAISRIDPERVNTTLDILNQIYVLGISDSNIGQKIRYFILQNMTPPDKTVYGVMWFGEKPESLKNAKPKVTPLPEIIYPFKPARKRNSRNLRSY